MAEDMASSKPNQRKLLIAVDSSGNSLAAFNFYLNMVSKPGDLVIMVHMFTPPNPPVMSSKILKEGGKWDALSAHEPHHHEPHHRHPFGHDLFLSDPNNEQWLNWRRNVDKAIDEYKKLLKLYENYCDEKGIEHRAIIHSGSPGEGICELSDEQGVDMIILGTRGLNKLRRTLLGSVSDYVLHHARRPVLVVPNSKENEETGKGSKK